VWVYSNRGHRAVRRGRGVFPRLGGRPGYSTVRANSPCPSPCTRRRRMRSNVRTPRFSRRPCFAPRKREHIIHVVVPPHLGNGGGASIGRASTAWTRRAGFLSPGARAWWALRSLPASPRGAQWSTAWAEPRGARLASAHQARRWTPITDTETSSTQAVTFKTPIPGFHPSSRSCFRFALGESSTAVRETRGGRFWIYSAIDSATDPVARWYMAPGCSTGSSRVGGYSAPSVSPRVSEGKPTYVSSIERELASKYYCTRAGSALTRRRRSLPLRPARARECALDPRSSSRTSDRRASSRPRSCVGAQ